jgi:hypothetical protein
VTVSYEAEELAGVGAVCAAGSVAGVMVMVPRLAAVTVIMMPFAVMVYVFIGVLLSLRMGSGRGVAPSRAMLDGLSFKGADGVDDGHDLVVPEKASALAF